MTVLDTTVLVDRTRKHPGAIAKVVGLQRQGSILRIPAMVWVEFLSPLAPHARAIATKQLEGAARFEDFDRTLADEAARLQHEMDRAGLRLAWTDLQIATTALHYNEPLISNDKGFDKVPGLLREGY